MSTHDDNNNNNNNNNNNKNNKIAIVGVGRLGLVCGALLCTGWL
jgi:predicted NAD/FAD-binding protein